MTMGILVLVLFFVYPLKFLFTLIIARNFGLTIHETPQISSPDDVLFLYTTFGLGSSAVAPSTGPEPVPIETMPSLRSPRGQPSP